MLWNYLKVSLRKLIRQWPYTLMGMLGLAIGISCVYLVLLYVHYESHYDQSYAKSLRIYRVEQSLDSKNWAASPRGVGPYLIENFPEIEQMTRLQPIDGAPWVKRGENIFKEDRVYYADSTTFDVFDLEWVEKDRAFPLSSPFSVVLTESMAKKYFGTENPMGQFLQFEFDGDQSREVVGVIRDITQQSHLAIDFLCSIYSYSERYNSRWGNFNTYTYVLSRNVSLSEDLAPSLSETYDDQYQVKAGTFQAKFTPVENIHLYSHAEKEMSINNRKAYLHILLVTGFFVWLISLINFINLHIIRYIKRNPEFRMRMALGAQRTQVGMQLLVESTLLILVSSILAISFIQIALGQVSAFTGLTLTAQYATRLDLVIYFGTIILFSILVSSLFPLIHFFRQPSNAFFEKKRMGLNTKKEGVNIRKGLVLGQFVFANFLLLSSVLIYKQLQFLLTKDLGFDHSHILVLPLDSERKAEYTSLKNAMQSLPHVQGISTAFSVPGNRIPIEEFELPGKGESHYFRVLYTGWDFDDVLNLEWIAGRSFVQTDVEAESPVWILNETAANSLFPDMDQVVGRNLRLDKYSMEGPIVGLVKDFHFESLHTEIVPLVFSVTEKNRLFNYALLKTSSQKAHLLKSLHQADQNLFAHLPPLEPIWMDQVIVDQYLSEEKLQQLVSIFCLISLILSMLGIIAFISFLVLQRTKEIAIRKILGSSQKRIAFLFGKELLFLVAITLLLSIPLSIFVLSYWLELFSYRVKMGPSLFLISGMILLVLTFASTAILLYRAMRADPVKHLKVE